MTQPIRIQRSRQHKQISPNGLPIKYCGRPGKYGNPFEIGYYYKISPLGWLRPIMQEAIEDAKKDSRYVFIDTKDKAADLYDKYVKQLAIPPNFKELKGMNLSCWCKVCDPCHVDTILKIANAQ